MHPVIEFFGKKNYLKWFIDIMTRSQNARLVTPVIVKLRFGDNCNRKKTNR